MLEELELAIDCRPDGKAFRRLNAIHLLLVGASFEVVLCNNRVSERTLRLWISRFNQQGSEGLTYRPYTGRTSQNGSGPLHAPPTSLPHL